jgi:hypothetical protein
VALYRVKDRYGETEAFVESETPITPDEAWRVVTEYGEYYTAKAFEKTEAIRRAERAGVLPAIPAQRDDESYRAWQARVEPFYARRRAWTTGTAALFKPNPFKVWLAEARPVWRQVEVIVVQAVRPEQREEVAEAESGDNDDAFLNEDE